MAREDIKRGAAIAAVAAVIAACIGAAAGLGSAYAGYMIGEKQYELERAKLVADIVVKTAGQTTDVFRGTLARLCLSPLLREDIDKLYQQGFKAHCPSEPLKQ